MANIERKPDDVVVDRASPLTTASLLAKTWTERRIFSRGKFREETPTETGAKEWRVVDKDEIRAEVYRFLDSAVIDTGNGMVEPFRPMKRDVDQVMDALKAQLWATEEQMVNENGGGGCASPSLRAGPTAG